VVSRVIVAADRPAPVPRNCSNAGPKSLVDRPSRYSSGITSATFGDLRDQAGKIAEENRFRSPVASSVRFVVDPRRPHRNRTRSCGHLPLRVVAVADHQPVAVLVELVGVGLDVGGDLGTSRAGPCLRLSNRVDARWKTAFGVTVAAGCCCRVYS
jgi:hypothetical protein